VRLVVLHLLLGRRIIGLGRTVALRGGRPVALRRRRPVTRLGRVATVEEEKSGQLLGSPVLCGFCGAIGKARERESACGMHLRKQGTTYPWGYDMIAVVLVFLKEGGSCWEKKRGRKEGIMKSRDVG
jgi:hypothetical protein